MEYDCAMTDLPEPRPNLTANDLEAHVQNVNAYGFTIIAGVLSESELTKARSLLDRIYESYDPRIDGRQKVEGYRFSANLVNKGPFFEMLFLKEPVYSLARRLLGQDCILSSANSLEPLQGQTNQGLHRDAGSPVAGRVMSMNSWWAIDPMDADNGATRLVPGSHGDDAPPKSMEGRAVQVKLSAGDVVAINARIVHGASANHSGRRRRVVHIYFVRHGEPQQTEQKRFLSPEVQARLSPLARRTLGLEE